MIRLLAAQLAEAEPNLIAEVVTTGGRVANLELVRDGRAGLGLALADVATSAVAGCYAVPARRVAARGRSGV